jgi:hypothetical protein
MSIMELQFIRIDEFAVQLQFDQRFVLFASLLCINSQSAAPQLQRKVVKLPAVFAQLKITFHAGRYIRAGLEPQPTGDFAGMRRIEPEADCRAGNFRRLLQQGMHLRAGTACLQV